MQRYFFPSEDIKHQFIIISDIFFPSLISLMVSVDVKHHVYLLIYLSHTEFKARSKDQEILEEGGGAGPSLLPRRDHE